MKYCLLAALLFFELNAFSQTQDSVSQKHSIETIWVDPIQLLPREISFYFDIEKSAYVKGYVFGFIYPNKIIADMLRTVHTSSQLKFTNYGFLAGLKYDFGENDNISFYTIGQYLWSNSVNIDRRSYVASPTFEQVNIDQKEASVITRFEADFTFVGRKVKTRMYLGLGFKVAYRCTFYNYGDKNLQTRYPEEDDSWAKVTNDNGIFIFPKAFLGYRIGYDLKK